MPRREDFKLLAAAFLGAIASLFLNVLSQTYYTNPSDTAAIMSVVVAGSIVIIVVWLMLLFIMERIRP